jgi:hypothetical protein
VHYILELTRGQNHDEVIERIRMVAETDIDITKGAFALVRDPGSQAEGFRILDQDGRVLAAAWTGPKPKARQ